MAAPGTREIDKVSKLEELEPEVLERLNLVLKALGFGSAEVAEMLSKDISETNAILAGKAPLTGVHLATICTAIGLRPGVVQGMRNFDRGESSTKGKAWNGPHKLFTEGHSSFGGYFQNGYLQVRDKPDVGSALKGIARGNHHVTIAQVRHVFRSLEVQRVKISGGLIALEKVMNTSVPNGIVTVDDYHRQRAVAPTRRTPMPPAQAEGADMSAQTSIVPAVPKIDWNEAEETVTIGADTYSLRPGEAMINVAKRVRELIRLHPEKPQLNTVLAACGVEVTTRSKILGAVEKGNQALSADAIRNLAEYFEISPAALFTGVGLGIPDPVTGTAVREPQAVDLSAREAFFKERFSTKGREDGLPGDVNAFDIFDLLKNPTADVSWLEVWLENSVEGRAFHKLVHEAVHAVKDMPPEMQDLYLEMQAMLLKTGDKSGD